MNDNAKTKIQEILSRGFDVPHAFRSALSKEFLFTQDEEILDVVFLEREYFNDPDKTVSAKAKMLIATTHGIIVMGEGLDEEDTNLLGYNLKHFLYDRIVSIEIDNCLLQSILKIDMDTCGNNSIRIDFNPAKYEQSIMQFINNVNKRMIEIKSIN